MSRGLVLLGLEKASLRFVLLLHINDRIKFIFPFSSSQGFEYLWADGVTVKTPIRCSAPQYIDYVMTWVEEHINNEAVFPSSPGM